MASKIGFVTSAAVLALLAGCIVSDQITTLTILPDGSAEWVKFQSNIRSTETGEKGAAELKQFIEAFDAHKDDDYQHITQAGGKVLEARWLRREVPCSNLMLASFPGASALESFCTVKGEKGELSSEARFTQDGKRRKFTVVIALPKDDRAAGLSKTTVEEMRREQANGVSETRIVVAGGQIMASRGFTVAADKRSALLEPAELDKLLKSGREKEELFLEWQLAGN